MCPISSTHVALWGNIKHVDIGCYGKDDGRDKYYNRFSPAVITEGDGDDDDDADYDFAPAA
ncbi:hypothetical protein RchiOBHm_Chr2g0089531 [Rosa chinensis]|uniref:Uncharacterized protein n=1 Tax=Rosa chinensis TaxID=74649 RepID=A0A2P6RJ86_ROSCH|nr:hypothetical protein RchiOBHm_Chr2g0089531 [Rosa chinensis]